MTVQKDGRDWRIGTADVVAWIRESTTIGREISAAIPPIFADYATILDPSDRDARSRQVDLILRRLEQASGAQPWWLGYLDTGADDVVFPDAPRTTLYSGWEYVLVLAGPAQTATWRRGTTSWRGPGPDMVFPTDRSWLLSWLWDDDWRCLGGPRDLIDAFVDEPELDVRRVQPGQDATPPGHVAN